jgi:predicted ester cyclase
MRPVSGNVSSALAAVIVALLCLLATGGQGQVQAPAAAVAPARTESAAPAASENQPIDTLPRKYVDLWNTGDFDQFKPFFSPFFMNSHGPRVMVDGAMLMRVITAWRKSMPDLTFKIEDTVIQGDKVAMRLTLSATYKSVLFPFTTPPAPTDPPRTIRAGEMLLFRIKDGKIVEIWEQYDELVMRQQMGGSWKLPATSTPSTKVSAKPTPPASKP